LVHNDYFKWKRRRSIKIDGKLIILNLYVYYTYEQILADIKIIKIRYIKL